MPLKLIVANRAVSSRAVSFWSRRPMEANHMPVEKLVIPLYHDDSTRKILEYSPAGKFFDLPVAGAAKAWVGKPWVGKADEK